MLVEGSPVFDGTMTAGREFLTLTRRVSVHDGRLTVDVGGGSSGFTTINSVRVAATTSCAASVATAGMATRDLRGGITLSP